MDYDEIHDRTVRRLVKSVNNQCLINNAERGAYVEHMIALAIEGQGWDLTWPWASWDLHHRDIARIEVKQSAARQPWHKRPRQERAPRPTAARFSIKPSDNYFLQDGTLVKTPLQRHADLYVFAWHPEENLKIANHRRPDQWKFFVVAESELPTLPDPPPKNISIGLKELKECAAAERGSYEALPDMVTKVLESIPEDSLKAVARKPSAPITDLR